MSIMITKFMARKSVFFTEDSIFSFNYKRKLEPEIPKKPGIYLLMCRVNSFIYVGKANDLEIRIGQHSRAENLSKDSKMQLITKAIRKHGWKNFTVVILETQNEFNLEELLDVESYYILLYNAIDRNVGYNITIYSNDRTGIPMSETAKEKLSTHHKTTQRMVGENNVMFGETHSEEVRKILSEKHTGKILSPETIEKLKIINAGEGNGMFGKIHSDETKEIMSTLKQGLYDGEKNPFYGKEHSDKTKQLLSQKAKERSLNGNFRGNSRAIIAYNNTEILKFNSVKEASIKFNIDKRRINKARKNKTELLGYYWKNKEKTEGTSPSACE